MKSLSRFIVRVMAMVVTLWGQIAVAQTNFWEQTVGPNGATVDHVLVQPNGNIFAVVSGKGLFRSTDGGNSYQPVNQGLTSTNILSIASNNNGDLFVGLRNGGIFRSTNNGDSWIRVYFDNFYDDIFCLFVDSQTGDIFAGTSFVSNGAVLRSTDNGTTWTRFQTGLSGAWEIQALVVQPSTGYVFAGSARGGVFRSTDRGNTWSALNTGLTYRDVLALGATSNGDLYAGADSSVLEHAVFRFPAGGNMWSAVLSPNSSVSSIVSSNNTVLVGTLGEGVFMSSDGGSSWTPRNAGLRSLTVQDLFVTNNNWLIAGTHCTGVFSSVDLGANWTALNGDLRATHILSLAVNPVSGSVFAGSHCGGVFRSTDGGMNWSWAGLPGKIVNTLLATNTGLVFAGTGYTSVLGSNGDIYRSIDDGANWTAVTPDNDGYFSLAVAPDGTIYAGTGFFSLCGFNICDYGDIFRSNDPNGTNWTRVADRLDDHVFGLAVNPTGRVFAATREGVYRSFSTFWHKVLNADSRSVTTLGDTVLVGTSDGILRSFDEGEFWHQVISLPNNFTWTLLVDPQRDIYAGTETGGVLRSTDGGSTWAAVNSGLTNMDVRALAFDPVTGRIFAGTDGDGVFRSSNPVTGITPLADLPPATTFELFPNYPNPFNPSTTIEFVVGSSHKDWEGLEVVTLRVYDLLGREVKTLVNGRKPAGRYTVQWDGTNDAGQAAASGVYLYRLQAGDFVSTRKMVLMR